MTAGDDDGRATSAGEHDDVGTVGQEAWRLLRALSTTAEQGDLGEPTTGRHAGHSSDRRGEHSCPHGWCPVCQTMEFVRDNPEVVAQVTTAGLGLARSLRDLLDSAIAAAGDPRNENDEKGDHR